MADVTGVIDARANVEFRIGSLFSRILTIFARGFWRYFAISLIPTLALVIVILLLPHFVAGMSRSAAFGVGFLSGFASQILFGFVAQGALAYGAFQSMRGREFGLGEALKRCLANMGPIFVTSLLATVITVAGILLFVVPGVIAGIALTVAIPVCVVECLGPIASLRRSAALTSGAQARYSA
jgi:hypothetical protein